MSTSGGASPGGLSINGTMPGCAARVDDNPALAFVDSCLRGVGQVVFMNNPITGLLILVAMFVGEAWLGFAGVLGLVVSTARRSRSAWIAARSASACSASTASSSAPGCRSSCSPTGISS